MINDLKSRTSSGISITSCIHPVIQLWNLGSVIEEESFETMHLRKMFPILYKEYKMNKYMRSLIKMFAGPCHTTSIKNWKLVGSEMSATMALIMQSTGNGGWSCHRLLTSTTGRISWLYFLLMADKRMSWM